MVSSLNFIRVIAAICHIEGDVPVDKYMDAYKPEKVRQHILNERNWYFKPHSVFCKKISTCECDRQQHWCERVIAVKTTWSPIEAGVCKIVEEEYPTEKSHPPLSGIPSKPCLQNTVWLHRLPLSSRWPAGRCVLAGCLLCSTSSSSSFFYFCQINIFKKQLCWMPQSYKQ